MDPTSFSIMFSCVYVLESTHECKCPQSPEEGVGSPGAGVSGSYELSSVGSGTRTWGL